MKKKITIKCFVGLTVYNS